MSRDPITIDAKPVPPIWATDPNASIPLGFIPRDAQQPDRFWLGEPGRLALVLLDEDWRSAGGEEWVNVAAGSFKAVCDFDCSREIAELIAKGWLTAAAALPSTIHEHAKRILVADASGRVH